jgi:hypothetical protein
MTTTTSFKNAKTVENRQAKDSCEEVREQAIALWLDEA